MSVAVAHALDYQMFMYDSLNTIPAATERYPIEVAAQGLPDVCLHKLWVHTEISTR